MEIEEELRQEDESNKKAKKKQDAISVGLEFNSFVLPGENWPPAAGFVMVSNPDLLLVLDAQLNKIIRAYPKGLYAPWSPQFSHVMGARKNERKHQMANSIIISDANGVVISPSQNKFAWNKWNQPVYVWNLATGALEWSLPHSQAIALLGENEEYIAVLTRGYEDPLASKKDREKVERLEFAVWDMQNNKKIFRQVFQEDWRTLSCCQLNSTRFAAFRKGGLWIWDQEEMKLRIVSEPKKSNLHSYYANYGSAKIAPDGKTFIFSTEEGFQRMNLADWTTPQLFLDLRGDIVGWAGGGKYLLIDSGDKGYYQLDAVTGQVLHHWNPEAIYVEFQNSRRRRFGVGKTKPLGSPPALDASGHYFAIWDGSRDTVVLWDVSISPPEKFTKIDARCSGGDCKEGLVNGVKPPGRNVFFPYGKTEALYVLGSGREPILRIDKNTLKLKEPVSAAIQIARAEIKMAEQGNTPSYSTDQCILDYEICTEVGRSALKNGDFNLAAMLLQKSCFIGIDRLACQSLMGWQDPEDEQLAKAAQCASHESDSKAVSKEIRCTEWKDELAKIPFDGEKWLSLCRAKPELCWVTGEMLSYNPDMRKTAIEISKIGCAAGYRHACITGATIAQYIKSPKIADELYLQACDMDEKQDCLDGQEWTSKYLESAVWERPETARPSVYSPAWCESISSIAIRSDFFAGRRYFSNGSYAGIRLTKLPPDEKSSPFQVGDILFDKGRCKPEACDAKEFLQWMNGVCKKSRSLLRDFELDVGSPDSERNRSIVLGKKRSDAETKN